MLTAGTVREKLIYDPVTGYFVWRTGQNQGKRAGSFTHHGYRRIKLLLQDYAEHRLAWLYVHGKWPTEIDHVDGVKSNNWITNLREVTRKENMVKARKQTRWTNRPHLMRRSVV